MAKKQFKAESRKLLDLMIHSIYSNREIFLRELISNGSDAIDKRRFASLTDASLAADWAITLAADEAARTLSISDNGCGMTAKEMEENLGTIAHSGTMQFRAEQKTDEELIGQFGVGFYAAFMVADEVTVFSRKAGTDEGHVWKSTGADGYTLAAADGIEEGTRIVLKLKQDDEDCAYGEFLHEHTLTRLVKKYSDYIRYPIKLGDKTLNSMVPLWRKRKNEVEKEEYARFYRDKFYDFADPAETFVAQVEGNINYSLLAFVPSKAPYDYYSREYKKGLALYSNGVLITDRCAELLPDWLGFVRGLVDSPDVSLNISRELLQQDRQLRAISLSVEKKIRAELSKWLKSDREGYEKMFAEFGNSLKMGAYDNFGARKDDLKDLLLFPSTEANLTTFAEYVSRMKEGQEAIYYASAPSVDAIRALPQVEAFLDKGYEILCLKENIDEFVIKVIESYGEKKFVSVADKDANAVTDEQKADLERKTGEFTDVLAHMQRVLGDKVKAVRLSARLVSAAVCMVSDSEISLEMEKVLRAMPGSEGVRADRVLELNPDHAAVRKLLEKIDDAAFADRTRALYYAALLGENLPLETADNKSVAELLLRL